MFVRLSFSLSFVFHLPDALFFSRLLSFSSSYLFCILYSPSHFFRHLVWLLPFTFFFLFVPPPFFFNFFLALSFFSYISLSFTFCFSPTHCFSFPFGRFLLPFAFVCNMVCFLCFGFSLLHCFCRLTFAFLVHLLYCSLLFYSSNYLYYQKKKKKERKKSVFSLSSNLNSGANAPPKIMAVMIKNKNVCVY